MTSKEQAVGPFGLSEVEGPSSLGVNGPESVLFLRSEVEGPHFVGVMRRRTKAPGSFSCRYGFHFRSRARLETFTSP